MMINANDVMRMKSVYFALKDYIDKREFIEMPDEEIYRQLKQHITNVCNQSNAFLMNIWKDWN